MKNTYVKPGFSLAPIALAVEIGGSCQEDIELIESLYGVSVSDPGTFGTSEYQCDKYQIAQFCKFTSANLDSSNKPIFGS